MTQVPAPTAQTSRARWRTRGWFFALGLAHAGLLLLAFEPINLWWTTPLAFIPLLIAAGNGPVRIPTAICLSVGTWPLTAIHHVFIMDIATPGYPPLFMYLAMWNGVFVWALSHMPSLFPRLPLWLLAPLLWTTCEMLRAQVLFDGYAWFLLGQPLINSSIVSAPAAIVGLFGVSFLVAAATASAYAIIMPGARRRRGPIIALLSLAAFWALANPLPVSEQAGKSIRVSVVQTNVPQSNKMKWSGDSLVRDFDRLRELTAIAARDKPDLIVWPETMSPTWVLTDAQIAETQSTLDRHPALQGLNDYITIGKMVRDQSRDLGVAILVGQESFSGLDFIESKDNVSKVYADKYNSSYLVDKGVVAPEHYSKLLLTPFGETIPYLRSWPWLRDLLLSFAARGMKVDLSTGTDPTVFKINTPAGVVRAVTPICFESTDPQLCRYLTYGSGALGFGTGERRADLLVCMTNDGWFGNWNPGRAHHLQLARWRCLELGMPMARAANTGMSAFIDARGRLQIPGSSLGEHISRPTANRDGVMTFDLRTVNGPTMYGRLGNVVGWGSLAATGFGLGWLVLSALAGRPSTKPKGT